MDILSRDKMICDALAACSVDLDSAVQLVTAVSAARRSVVPSRVAWGAPPRFVPLGPDQCDESGMTAMSSSVI